MKSIRTIALLVAVVPGVVLAQALPADPAGTGSGSAQPAPAATPAPEASPAPATTPAAPVTETVAEPAAPEPPPPEPPPPPPNKSRRNFAGSVQLDYMAVPSESNGRKVALDGATVEASLKLAMDFSHNLSANVKMCVACHGVEIGMAYFDIRVRDELNFRVGRFTPSFGEFPVRHDPANHRTSDKPLPYDMGRMVRITEWNEGVLPAPWVDNGVEINGTHFFNDKVQTDYAVYAIGGPRAGADPTDFDFKQSRSGESYYVDNNSRPVIGGQVVASMVMASATLSGGLSMMRGTYDPEHTLPFSIAGAHLVLRARDLFLRAEYLVRRTKMSLGEDPMERFKYGPGSDGTYDPWMVKDGGVVELEVPVNKRVTVIAREDGLRRRGNVVATNQMRSDSAVIRHTVAAAILLWSSVRLKASYEYYDFSDFSDESVVHVGLAGPF